MEEVAKFGAFDYVVFSATLLVSALIGVYFGFFGKRKITASEYVLGNKTMKATPVALSLIASAISGITLIGVPTEVYSDSTLYLLVVPSLLIVCLIFSYFFLPIFYDLNVTCAYEYLERRFNRSLRILISISYCISNVMFLPAVIYTPSLSLSLVTGINVHIISFITTLICVLYTLIGGFRAVVWTDFFQVILILISSILIIIIGTVQVGGLSYVLRVANHDGKLKLFEMDPNPFQRNTFWTVTLGTIISWTCGLVSGQGSVQRFMSLPTLRDGQLVLIIYWAGTGILTTFCVYSGLLLYSVYYGCDPIENNEAMRPDQIFPYYIMDKLGYVPGLAGIFIAGIFSAGLSTLSTVLNTVASTIYEDFLKGRRIKDYKSRMIMQFIIVIIGMVCVIMVVAIEKIGTLLPVTYMITSVTSTPVSVVFILGMLIPQANTKGAFAGSLASAAFLLWLLIGSSVSKINFVNKSVYPIDSCPITTITYEESTMYTYDKNATNNFVAENDQVFFLYKLSYMLYFPFGLIVGIIVGVIVSYLTGPTDPSTLDPNVISPPLRRFLPKNESLPAQEKLMVESRASLEP